MRILVIGDLHGRMPKIHFKEFDAIICVGDFCYDEELKIPYKKSYKIFLKNPYNRLFWWDIAGRKRAKKIIQKSLRMGRKILVKLNSYGVPIYSIPGNWDLVNEDDEWSYLDKDYYRDYLIKGLKNVHDVDGKIRSIGNLKIIGYGLVNGPELLKYRRYKDIKKKSYERNERNYKRLVARYDKIFLKTKRSGRSIIFLSHNVPFNTPLDKIRNKDSLMDGHHYGSNLARDMIVRHKPLLNIGGHMHEHYGICRIGKTVVLNAGYGPEKNTLIEIEDGKIKSMKFYGKKC